MEQGLDILDITAKLESIVQMVWPSFCNEILERIEALPAGSGKLAVKAACTHILGGFSGSVSVEIEVGLMHEAVRDMMRIEEVSNDDMDSVIKELVNVISGNLKGILSAKPSILSTPKAFDEVGFNFELSDNQIITAVLFKTEKGLMIVKLHQATELDIPNEKTKGQLLV